VKSTPAGSPAAMSASSNARHTNPTGEPLSYVSPAVMFAAGTTSKRAKSAFQPFKKN